MTVEIWRGGDRRGRLARRSYAERQVRAAALVALCAIAPAVAFADQPAATQVAKVSLSGLDLATGEGSRAAYARIKTVAERLSIQAESEPFREIYARCVRETLADLIRRINAPNLAALEK
jgi:UrcA family protein